MPVVFAGHLNQSARSFQQQVAIISSSDDRNAEGTTTMVIYAGRRLQLEAEAERYVQIEIANEDSVNWGIVTRPSSVNHFKGIPRNVVGYSEIGVVQKIGWIHPPTPLPVMS